MTNQKGDGCGTCGVRSFDWMVSSHVKEERWTKKDIGEFVNRDLMVNNIYEFWFQSLKTLRGPYSQPHLVEGHSPNKR